MINALEQVEYAPPLITIQELFPKDILDVWLIMCLGQKFPDSEIKQYLSKIRKSPFYQCWLGKTFQGVTSFLIYRLDLLRQTYVITDFGVYREFDGDRLDCLLDRLLRLIKRKNSSYKKMAAEIRKTNPLVEVFLEKGFQEDPLAQQFYEEYNEDYLYLSLEP